MSVGKFEEYKKSQGIPRHSLSTVLWKGVSVDRIIESDEAVTKRKKEGQEKFLYANGTCNECSLSKEIIRYKLNVLEKDFPCKMPNPYTHRCKLNAWVSFISSLSEQRVKLAQNMAANISRTITSIKTYVTNKTADYATKTQNLSNSSQNCRSLLKLKTDAITDLCKALSGGVGIILGSMLLGEIDNVTNFIHYVPIFKKMTPVILVSLDQ